MVALLVRAVFLLKFRLLTDDSFVYGDIARNWLLHHVYGLTELGQPVSTWIRMPGYPGFLAGVWAIFGVEHYTAVLVIQCVIDVGTCIVVADIALRTFANARVARNAFAVTALCPFFANYAAVALTETLSIFLTALAIDFFLAALEKPRVALWIATGFAIGTGILIRPDGCILLAAAGVFLLLRLIRDRRSKWLVAGFAVAISALIWLVPWTIRNWNVFHRFEPLTPVYASAPDEFVPYGFARWVRTWIVDYVSVDEIWFEVSGQQISMDSLPRRAFDSREQQDRTEELLDDYNQTKTMSPDIDAQFAELAKDRISHSRLRYYVWLPLLRAADLWLRPRTEMLPLDPHWWRWSEDAHDSSISMLLGLLNLGYIGMAVVGVRRGRIPALGFFSLFVVIRTAFLAWMPNPEPRYMLECYPILLALSAAGIASCTPVRHRGTQP